MIHLRLVSASEARSGGLSPSQHGDLLYSRRLVDAPKIMDLCVLYGQDNARLTRGLVQQVRAQPCEARLDYLGVD